MCQHLHKQQTCTLKRKLWGRRKRRPLFNFTGIMQIKIATTLDRQIELLKERGLSIGDEEKAKEILSDIGYYRLGFYWFPFEETYPKKKDRTHKFKKGSRFEDAVRLYYFDNDLRALIVPYLHRIEINLRTNIIYNVSNDYAQNPTWFADPKIMTDKFIAELPDRYDNLRKNEALRRHHNKYINDRYAPAWKTLEYMTFGEMLYLFDNLRKEEIKIKIASRYAIKNLEVFSNQMQSLRMLRNVCAHGHNLFDYRFSKSIKPGNIKGTTPEQRNSVSGGLILVSYMLGGISVNRQREFINKVRTLVSDVDFDDIRNIIGNITAEPALKSKLGKGTAE